MRVIQVLATGIAFAMLSAGSAFADSHSDEPKIYPVHSSHNYCPAGLQPVTISGEICCGKPNQSMTYQQVMAHGGSKRRAQSSCPVGSKGCTFD